MFAVANNVVWPGYFEVMGIPLLRGRTFADADGRPDAPIVAVVNDTMARALLAGRRRRWRHDSGRRRRHRARSSAW